MCSKTVLHTCVLLYSHLWEIYLGHYLLSKVRSITFDNGSLKNVSKSLILLLTYVETNSFILRTIWVEYIIYLWSMRMYRFLMKHFIIWCKLSNGRTWKVWCIHTIPERILLWVNAINMIIPYRTHTSKIKMTSESYMFDLHLPVKIVWWWMKISSKRLTEAWCPQCEKNRWNIMW